MLHRLVRRPVFAEADRIMGHDEDHALAHQRGKPDRRAAIVGEDEEAAAIGDEPAVQSDAVHRRRHAMLAHAIMDVAPGIVGRRDQRHLPGLGVVGAGEVGGAPDELRHERGERFQHLLGGLAGRKLRRFHYEAALQACDGRIEARGQLAADPPIELVALGMGREAPAPFVMGGRAAGAEAAPGGEHPLRYDEGLVGPAEPLAGAGDLLGSQRRAMGRGGAGLGRRAIADHRPAGDQAGAVRDLRPRQRVGDRLRGMAVDALGIPAERAEAPDGIVAGGERGGAVDGDPVVVEEDGEPVQLQMAGQRAGFVADPFHQAAVAGEGIGAVVDQLRAEAPGQHALGQRHAHRIGEPLAQGARGGLDARRVAELGVARGPAAELPEALELLDRHLRIAGEVEERIEQHRAVPVREHEAVAVRPVRMRRIELQKSLEKDRRHIGHAHRHAGMPGVRLLHRIHRKGADGIGEVTMRNVGGAQSVHVRGLESGAPTQRRGTGVDSNDRTRSGGEDAVRARSSSTHVFGPSFRRPSHIEGSVDGRGCATI